MDLLNEDQISDEEVNKAIAEDQNEYLNKFQQEKFEEIQSSVPQVDNMMIKPGWGDWTGQGIPLSERQIKLKE